MDYHLHTNHSMDGRQTMPELCETMLARGVQEIALTEHIEPGHPEEEMDVPPVWADWFAEIARCRAAYPALVIRSGIEIGDNPLCRAETKALLESLDRVSVVISEKLKSPVRCLFDMDKVYLSARTGNGEAKDICPVKGDGRELEIGFNNRYLMDALRYAPADKVHMQLNTGISPCIITPVDGGDEFLYMVLPVRLKAQ